MHLSASQDELISSVFCPFGCLFMEKAIKYQFSTRDLVRTLPLAFIALIYSLYLSYLSVFSAEILRNKTT